MSDETDRRVPLAEERAHIEKRVVERNRVTIRTATAERQQILSDALRREQVDIRRVAVDKEVDAIPEVREEGDLIIIPIVEERAVVVKRLVLVEELHVQREVLLEPLQVPLTLRSTQVFVESQNPATKPANSNDT